MVGSSNEKLHVSSNMNWYGHMAVADKIGEQIEFCCPKQSVP